ncbi:hypothetical protein E4U42_003058 [Claviceps africana]|uniref:Uncharacterized protein n=1 Tax=Claviceps africana TaxID=83212 RepID=A0A8K0NJB0_9HYPO|nr:hypothetical protein E4U42_003058 [Claviceps africana]
MTEEFRKEYHKAARRIAENRKHKEEIMLTMGLLDKKIHETTRYLSQQEQERAAAMFARPRTAQLDEAVARLTDDVDCLRKCLQALEYSKAIRLRQMREVDGKLECDRRVMEVCRVD